MAVYFGKSKILDNGVAGTSLVLGHGETHASGGSDPITPESIGAAPVKHTHNYAPAPIMQTITLPRANWTLFSSGCMQTLDVAGMRAGSLALIACHPDYYDDYMESRVRCAVQGWDALTFAAKKVPNNDLDVHVLIMR